MVGKQLLQTEKRQWNSIILTDRTVQQTVPFTFSSFRVDLELAVKGNGNLKNPVMLKIPLLY